MRDIRQYFALITRVAERSGAASVDMEFHQRDSTLGRVNGAISFYDGSRLEFRRERKITGRRADLEPSPKRDCRAARRRGRSAATYAQATTSEAIRLWLLQPCPLCVMP